MGGKDKFPRPTAQDNQAAIANPNWAVYQGWAEEWAADPECPSLKRGRVEHWAWRLGVVTYKGKVAVPASQRRRMLNRLHLYTGHGGQRKMVKAAESCMQWIGMRGEASTWALTWHECQLYKARHTKIAAPHRMTCLRGSGP